MQRTADILAKGPFIFYEVGGGGDHAKQMAFEGGHLKKIREKGRVT